MSTSQDEQYSRRWVLPIGKAYACSMHRQDTFLPPAGVPDALNHTTFLPLLLLPCNTRYDCLAIQIKPQNPGQAQHVHRAKLQYWQ
jgi:hypothetical protein